MPVGALTPAGTAKTRLSGREAAGVQALTRKCSRIGTVAQVKSNTILSHPRMGEGVGADAQPSVSTRMINSLDSIHSAEQALPYLNLP